MSEEELKDKIRQDLSETLDRRIETAKSEEAAGEAEADGSDSVGSCCGRCCAAKEPPRGKLHCHNYLADIPGGYADSEFVEVQFKNTRKGFYRNTLGFPLEIGDWVAVEAQPGHDIGRVSLTGLLVRHQMKKANIRNEADLKRVFRLAKPADLEKFEEVKAKENDTMIRSRKIAEDLNLNMKIGDVEYQGDGSKAIFYYIADERVDFRQLIKVLADAFKIRIEMKQIGARQEAGRIGGIGPCGRPLCCSSWMTNFVSVGTSAARFQDISLNPQKLAGQCAKLKCCLNFEVDAYVEASKKLPPKDVRLETVDATYFLFKTDIFKGELTYSTDKSIAANLVTITSKRAFEVIQLNKSGEKPLSLLAEGQEDKNERKYNDILDQDNLTRFDNKKRKKKKNKNKNRGEENRPAGDVSSDQPAPQAEKPAANDRKNRQNRDNRRQGDKRFDKHDGHKTNHNGNQNGNSNPEGTPYRDSKPNHASDHQRKNNRSHVDDRSRFENKKADNRNENQA